MDTTNRIESDLKPRAIALLCALRQGPLSLHAVRNRIGDRGHDDTEALIRDMIKIRLVAWVGSVSLHLDHDGVGWLETNGLTAAHEARLWVAREEQGK